MEAPWVPKSDVVYAKNIDEFRDSTEVEDIKFDARDEKFYQEFSTGAVSVRWQREMIDSGLFDEMNDPKLREWEPAWMSRTCNIL